MHLTLYLWILASAVAGFFGFNVFVSDINLPRWVVVTCALVNPFIIFGLDAIAAAAIHALPAKYFDPYLSRFNARKNELSFYRRLRINSWKDYIPDTGKLTTGLSKSHIEGTKADYLYRFLVETCYAETIHYWMAVMGIIPIFFAPRQLMFTMMIPHAIVNFLLNVPPVMIQRNNRPKLIHMYERQLKVTQQQQ